MLKGVQTLTWESCPYVTIKLLCYPIYLNSLNLIFYIHRIGRLDKLFSYSMKAKISYILFYYLINTFLGNSK